MEFLKELIDYRAIVEVILLMAVAIATYFKVNGVRRGNNPGNPSTYKRPSMMSKETKEEINRIWDKAVLTKECEKQHEGVNNRLTNIEGNVTEIKTDVKDIGHFLRNGKWKQ